MSQVLVAAVSSCPIPYWGLYMRTTKLWRNRGSLIMLCSIDYGDIVHMHSSATTLKRLVVYSSAQFHHT